MLPLQQAIEVRKSILEYIKATYHFKDGDVGREFYRFIENEKNGLFKGPYISLKPPFVKAEDGVEIPLDIAPSFKPHWHQQQAFERLTTKNGHKPVPTLLTTGTGSGKTECFLYPILDYCYQCNKLSHKPGVKVIIMYPMNALASDQAKRLAEAINDDARLNGRVTAGLCIGEGEGSGSFPTTMGADHIIEDRQSIVDSVPDILLTNFKMLDYGLMQQRYMPLWKGNVNEANPALRFIVLDELHTYDGAQGTDVANLIRRLKLKLNLGVGHLCPIGTSATIGNGADSKRLLCEYAGQVFGEHFDEENVIEEHRVPVEKFFDSVVDTGLPSEKSLIECQFQEGDDTDGYLRRLRRIWLPAVADDPFAIGDALRKLPIVRDLLKVTSLGITSLDDLAENLARENRDVGKLYRVDESYALTIVESLLALISIAKTKVGEKDFPLLQLQVQLWVRELSGILRYVQKEPMFAWKGKVLANRRAAALSMYYCRECGASGWLSRRGETDRGYGINTNVNNSDFMSHKPEVMLLNTVSQSHRAIQEYLGTGSCFEAIVNTATLRDADSESKGSIKLVVCNKRSADESGRQSFNRMCPECGSESLSIVGTKIATLSSVAMSQVFSSDFDSAESRDRKILTFTNSVQDAAFQAGFYESRTYNFLFRQSLQQYLDKLNSPVSLIELQRGFKDYWKHNLSGDEYYYRFLAKDLIGDVDLKHNYRENGDYTARFKEEFDLRVDWDICSEFGLNAQVGRTLEKTGSSATYFDKADLENAWLHIENWVAENQLLMTQEEFVAFANGILHRMRIRGAIDHPYLNWFRDTAMDWYKLNWGGRDKQIYDERAREHFLNHCFGKSSKMPKMVTTTERLARENANGPRREIADCTYSKNDGTWFVKYFYKSFANSLRNALNDGRVAIEIINDFYKKFFDVLVECDLANRKDAGNGNYALNPEKIYVQPRVRHFVCSNCNTRLDVAADDTVSGKTKCLTIGCDGFYEDLGLNEENYYRLVYKRNKSPRIYAREHTGILQREYREKLEMDFKNHPNFDSVNALSATSTLEMGIDIGDLNVVANADIPPKPSNFMQRVGRAGRKSGTALVLNYANQGNEHDLFFFDEPMEMMAGDVTTPGCFLEAKDILRRHFFAFCIDSWISANKDNDIPRLIRILGLRKNSVASPDFKINELCGYIKENAETLMSRFESVYPNDSRDAIEILFESVRNDSFFDRIKQEFVDLADRLEKLVEARKDILDASRNIGDEDPRKIEYTQQWRALNNQINHIQDTQTIEFMTDVGLLPNYAFPEKGVELNADIRMTMAKNDSAENVAKPTEINIVRPASSGIKELAPGNVFFTQGHKLKVTGIDVSTLLQGQNPRQNALKKMRFCSRCDCIAEIGTEAYGLATCPKCGDGSWGANEHLFLDFKAAICRTTAKESVLNDSSEERKPAFFVRKSHFRFNDQVNLSYAIKDSGFGIEFCKDVEVSAVNYGSRDGHQNCRTVAGDARVPELGFIICKKCGRATSVLSSRDPVWHYGYCQKRDVEFNPLNIDTDVFETTYLYRSFNTEAIKVLLPVQNFDSEAMIQMFKAGLALGLKAFYQSTPDHIRIERYAEYNKAVGDLDNYLVLYDTIPGGTGYLTKLFSPENFSKVIEFAYERIHNCKCADDGHDGCYHCIYTYENKYKHADLSRSIADSLFEKLKSQLNNWETYTGSLGTVSRSSQVEDSELELKFIKELGKVAQEKQWLFERKTDVDAYHYELVINEKDRELKYVIWPQYKSLAYTVPDFQFKCVYARINGKAQEVEQVPEWSVFLDGYAYHASKNCFRFYGDVKKRDSIRNNRNMVFPWTIVYDDLFDREHHRDGSFEDDLYRESLKNDSENFPNNVNERKNSFERFIYMITLANIDDIRGQVFNYLACWYINPNEKNYCREEDVDSAIIRDVSDEYADRVPEAKIDNNDFFVKTKLLLRTNLVQGSMWFRWEGLSSKDDVHYSFRMNENLGEIALDDWKRFWQAYNLLQFFTEVSESGIVNNNNNIESVLEAYDSAMEPIIRALANKGIWINPDGETAIVNEDDEVVAEADLVVREKKIAVNLWDEGQEKVVENLGYKVFTADNFNIDEVR